MTIVNESKLTKEEKRAVKELKRAEKAGLVISPQPNIFKPCINGVSILCVRYGNKYGREYVERLRNMIARNITVPYEFVCLTDDQHPIKNVISIYQPSSNYNKQWWHKVHIFDKNLPLKERVIYFDLDVVVHNNIDNLVYHELEKLSGIRDFNRKFHSRWNYLNSSVMAWQHGAHHYIYDMFIKDKSNAMRLHGDQDWIYRVARNNLVFWPDDWIQSYKWEIRSRDEIQIIQGKRKFRNESNVKPNLNCSVSVFHGDPKPEDVTDPFIVEHWK